MEIAVNLDVSKPSQIYREHGRVQIRDFLSEDTARRIHVFLVEEAEWRLSANRGEQIVDFHPDQVSAWTEEQHALLEKAVTMGGRYGFQFRYDVIRVKDGSPRMLAEFEEFMSSPPVVDFLRTLTSDDGIAFADAHASRYRPGHFLTTHDDRVDSMGRRAAYVLNLTSQWRPDWGGLLQFYDAEGNVERAFTPSFNVLNVFRVPTPHSVSWVTPLAAAPRYAITGWLRAN